MKDSLIRTLGNAKGTTNSMIDSIIYIEGNKEFYKRFFIRRAERIIEDMKNIINMFEENY